MRLREGEKFEYAGREWTVVRVEELSYFAKSGDACGYFSFACLEQS